jgi:transposase InsO family protein
VSTGTWVISYRRILRVKPSNGMSRSGSPSAGEYTEEEVENARLLLELKKKQAEDNTERMQSSAHATEQQLMSVDAVVELIRRLVPSGASPARYASDTMTTGEPTPGNFCVMPDLTQGLKAFSGRGGYFEARNWLRDIKAMGRRQFWNENIILEMARQHLQGSALNWYRYHQEEIRTWSEFEEKFREKYEDTRTLTERVHEMEARVQGKDESAEDYFYTKMRLCRELKLEFQESKKLVLMGLKSREAARTILLARHYDETSLLKDILDSEQFYKGQLSGLRENRTECARGKDVLCFKCQKRGHISKNCTAKIGEASDSTGKVPVSFSKKQSAPTATSQVMCFKCNEMGHYASRCEKRERTTENAARQNVNVATENNILFNDSNLKFFKDAKINGKQLRSYVDLGSQVCALRDDCIAQLRLNCNWANTKQIMGYGGAITATLGDADVDLEIDGVVAKVKLQIVPKESQEVPLLVGHPFTEQGHIQVIKTANELLIREVPVTENISTSKVALWARDMSVIPNNFLGHVVVRSDVRERELCVEGGLREIGGVVPRCVVTTDKEGEAVLPVLNISGKDVTVNKNDNVARGEPCREGTRRAEVNDDPIDVSEINTELSGDELLELQGLLVDFKDLVARNMRQLGCTNVLEMDLHLTDDQPVFYRPYRMSFSERGEVQRIVQELKEADIIEETDSPFASPVLLVRKKSGEFRMCVDYRALNKKTVKQHYPLPHIDDQLDRLRGQVYYTSLDLSGAYHQVPMSSDARQKTAFITPDGVYCFKRMSFGLANAPSVFQRLINTVLGNLRYDTAMAYLDDVIIPSKTVSEGLAKIKDVFERFRHANLTLNLTKCYFFMRKIEYLGFTISEKGIEPGEKKARAVAEFNVPTDIHKVRSFLGLASYFRRFIKGFATVARPLSDMLRKGETFVWGDAQQEAFDKIKDLLVNKPILSVYDPAARTELHTDACSLGLGAILLQEQKNGKLLPVSYYSRKTTREESLYSSYELEGLAIVAALDRFRVYLLGIPFVIRTDCNSLKLLANKKDLNPRIGRWFVKLSEYNYTIEYQKGENNQVADALSRNPVENATEVPINGLPEILGITINTDWVAALQRTCDETKAVLQLLETGDRATHERFTLYKGRVYRVKGLKWRLYVPVDLRQEIVDQIHRELMHLGIDKTLAKLKELYYFPKMREFVAKRVNRCISCLFYKTPRGKPPGYLHPLEKGKTPFQVIHMDHLGPFPTTNNDKKYVAAIIGGFSKYVVLRAVASVGAEEAVDMLRDVISHYGRPNRLITDRGTAFVANLFEEFCTDHHIQHVRIATATPRANGQVERLNSMIISCTAAGTSEIDAKDWDEKLCEVQWAINSAVHSVTKCTPFSLVHGYEREGFGDNPLPDEIRSINREIGTGVETSKIPLSVGSRLEQNREKMARQFNKGRREAPVYKEGDLVLVRSEAPATGESRKLVPKYRGPYEIVKFIGNDRYVIQDIEGEQQSNRLYKGIIAIDRLKLLPV